MDIIEFLRKRIEIKDINRKVEKNAEEFVRECEDDYKQLIKKTAQTIIDNSAERPLILLSGPSGSGKTTTALRLESYLEAWGHHAHTISLDNYFDRKPDMELPLDDDGNIDLESPKFVDAQLLQKHLEIIAEGGTIDVPKFDFKNQCREEKATPLTRKPGEIVIVEGIHSLIPEITGTADEYSMGLYVSIRTRIIEDDEVVIHPQNMRLLRRMVRNRLYRGESYEETVRRMRSVNRGENLYIMPYKEHAKLQIDTFLPYELCLFADMTLGELRAMPAEAIEAAGIGDMLERLESVTPISPELVPPNSLLREFIGGSELKY